MTEENKPKYSKWMFYKIYVGTEEYKRHFARVDYVLKQFYERFYDYIHGVLLWHYYEYYHADKPSNDGLSEAEYISSNIDFDEGDDTAYIRFRFRVRDDMVDQFRQQMEKKILPECGDGVIGWRYYDNYDVTRDLGNRFGNADKNIDPSEPLIKLFTGCVELRWFYLENPMSRYNHDVLHLYFNTMGAGLRDEIDSTIYQIAKTMSWMKPTCVKDIVEEYLSVTNGLQRYLADAIQRFVIDECEAKKDENKSDSEVA